MVAIANTRLAPSKAATTLGGSSRSIATTSAPTSASARAASDSTSRVSARMLAPRASSSRAVAEPCLPVAPTTAITSPGE
jgi:hypothetical protein